MKDNTSIGNDLEMRPSGRHEGHMMVVMNKYSKSSLCDDSGIEQVGDYLVLSVKKLKYL